MKNFYRALFVLMMSTPLFSPAQNVGIGNASPQFKLDVAGRLRLQTTPGFTAGLWLDGPTNPLRSFIGMIDNDHAGIWGTGTSWKFSFNVNNGSIGIGTTTPTAALDINGALRFRQTGANVGSTLNSIDLFGNAKWSAPVAFRVNGYSAGADILFPEFTWQEINFGNNVAYNQSFGYNSTTSEFTAPVRGIYEFKSSLLFTSASEYVAHRLRLRRNGNVSTIIETRFEFGDGYTNSHSSLLDTEYLLEIGDQVWIEAFSVAVSQGTQQKISGGAAYTWWCGRLVIPWSF